MKNKSSITRQLCYHAGKQTSLKTHPLTEHNEFHSFIVSIYLRERGGGGSFLSQTKNNKQYNARPSSCPSADTDPGLDKALESIIVIIANWRLSPGSYLPRETQSHGVSAASVILTHGFSTQAPNKYIVKQSVMCILMETPVTPTNPNTHAHTHARRKRQVQKEHSMEKEREAESILTEQNSFRGARQLWGELRSGDVRAGSRDSAVPPLGGSTVTVRWWVHPSDHLRKVPF